MSNSLAEALLNYATLLELPDPRAFEARALILIKSLADHCEQGDEPDEPLWLREDLFTDEERSSMIEQKMDEIRDDIKGVAETLLDLETDMIDLVAYLGTEIEVVAEYLDTAQASPLHLHRFRDGQVEDRALWSYMLRFKLIAEDGTVTDLGKEYAARYL